MIPRLMVNFASGSETGKSAGAGSRNDSTGSTQDKSSKQPKAQRQIRERVLST